MGQGFARHESTESTMKWHLFMDNCAFFKHCTCLGRWCTRFSTRRKRSLSDVLIDDTSTFRRSSERRQEDVPQSSDQNNLATILDRERDGQLCCCSRGRATCNRASFPIDSDPHRKSGKNYNRSTGSASSRRVADSFDVPQLQSNASQCGRSSVRVLTPERMRSSSDTTQFPGRLPRSSSVHIYDASDAAPLTPLLRDMLAGQGTHGYYDNGDQTQCEVKSPRSSLRASEHSTFSRESSSGESCETPTCANSQTRKRLQNSVTSKQRASVTSTESSDVDESPEGLAIRLTMTPGRKNRRLMSFYDEDGGWWTRPSLTLCEVEEIPDPSLCLSHVTNGAQFFNMTRTDTGMHHRGFANKGKSTAFENCRQFAQSSKGGECLFNDILSRRSSW